MTKESRMARKQSTDTFSSFEELEREFMPMRHQARLDRSHWAVDEVASEMATTSLQAVRAAVQKGQSAAG